MPSPLADCCELTVATSNSNKLRELTFLLRRLRVLLHPLPTEVALNPVTEDGHTLAANARKKAVGYAKQLGRWVISDDTGLEVDALNGAPGVHSARFAGPTATAKENRAMLVEKLKHVPDSQRAARFVCRLCVADPAGEVIIESQGVCQGAILTEPVGSYGFGYDSLFLVKGMNLALAQLDPNKTAEVGHRGQAAKALVSAWLQRV